MPTSPPTTFSPINLPSLPHNSTIPHPLILNIHSLHQLHFTQPTSSLVTQIPPPMDSTSPYQIHYAALQTRILAFQSSVFDFLQLYSKSPASFDDNLAATTAAQLEHNYHTLIAEVQQYQQQLQFLEKTSTIPDNALASHQPISHHPNHPQHNSHDTTNYDIDLRALNQETDDIELFEVLEQFSYSDIKYSQHPHFSNIALTSPSGIPNEIIAQQQQQHAQTLAKMFNLSNTNLAVPVFSNEQGANIPLPLPQPTVTQGALINSWTIIRKLTNLTLQCDRLSTHFQTILAAPH